MNNMYANKWLLKCHSKAKLAIFCMQRKDICLLKRSGPPVLGCNAPAHEYIHYGDISLQRALQAARSVNVNAHSPSYVVT